MKHLCPLRLLHPKYSNFCITWLLVTLPTSTSFLHYKTRHNLLAQKFARNLSRLPYEHSHQLTKITQKATVVGLPSRGKVTVQAPKSLCLRAHSKSAIAHSLGVHRKPLSSLSRKLFRKSRQKRGEKNTSAWEHIVVGNDEEIWVMQDRNTYIARMGGVVIVFQGSQLKKSTRNRLFSEPRILSMGANALKLTKPQSSFACRAAVDMLLLSTCHKRLHSNSKYWKVNRWLSDGKADIMGTVCKWWQLLQSLPTQNQKLSWWYEIVVLFICNNKNQF